MRLQAFTLNFGRLSVLRFDGHRQDLAATEANRPMKEPRVALDPGHWEFQAKPAAGYYLESITANRGGFQAPKRDRPAEWFDVLIEPRSRTRITVSMSNATGEISGSVLADGKPTGGAPVYLWPVAEAARRSLGGSLQTISDTDGKFRFRTLPPGDYRLLASFDVYEIDEELLESSHAPVIHAERAQTTTADLTVWIAP